MAHDQNDARVVLAGVITVSDTRTMDDDEGGALVARLLEGAGHQVAFRTIVPDDEGKIEKAIWRAVEDPLHVAILTGGTGIAKRDVTYEVVARLLEKTLDGFGEAFRRLSWEQVGARSILSRAVAGTLRSTLVVALPGSPKGIELAMSAVLLPVLRHAVGLVAPR